MDVKELRVESSLGDRNERSYAHASNAAHGQDKNKPYQEVGPTPISKGDVQAVRPCAVIGPDRVVPQQSATYHKKQEADGWGYNDGYRKLPEYPHKLGEHQLPSRNISPRQTFQESMPRIIVPQSAKLAEDSNNAYSEKVSNLNETVKYNLPGESKYYDVPYIVSPVGSEQRNAPRMPDVYAPQSNSPLMRTHGWPVPVANPPRPYGSTEVHHYPEYPNSNSRPVPPNTLRQMHDGNLQHFPDPYLRNTNMRYQPYPTSKELAQNARYEYNNYPNSYHPQLFPPQSSSQKYMLQKTFPPNTPYMPSYPPKYLDTRIPQEPHLDGYQRPPNNQPPGFNLSYQGHSLLPNYTHNAGNCISNKVYYPEGNIKPPMKGTYENPNKIPIDPGLNQLKNYQMNDNLYNEMRPYPVKGPVIMHNYPSNMPPYPSPHYRKEFVPHYVDPSMNIMNPYSRIPPHFSPNIISPTDSNTSNDTYLSQDCGYISQSSSGSGRSLDQNRFHNPEMVRRFDYRYPPFNRSPISRPDNRRSKSDKKNIDVRQFLQMWNEGDDEANENSVKDSSIMPNNTPKHVANSQEELYVLGLVNVSTDELKKYEHIQKVSKLPENIKGYNSLELLDQFEEVIGASNVCSAPPIVIKDKNDLRINSAARPASPLDVEAKISQSVIHKEVGCNFEIKPCSPKMLNVEMATPALSVIGERTIEKVSNPHTLQHPNKPNSRDTIESFNAKQSNELDAIPSCKMIAPRSNDMENHVVKTDYTIHDLENSSGVCLASLPRLDTDIEFNFPEVNQQFIDANREASSGSPLRMMNHSELNYVKADITVMSNSNELDNSIPKNETGDMSVSASPLSTSSYDSDKNYSKLSKFRKSKSSKDVDRHANIQCQRINSVIIKNPENIERNSIVNDDFKADSSLVTSMNMPVINKDDINENNTEKLSPLPINLSYQDKLIGTDMKIESNEGSTKEHADSNLEQKTVAINLSLNNCSDFMNDNLPSYNCNSNRIPQESSIIANYQANEHIENNFQETLDLSDSVLDSITNLNSVDGVDHVEKNSISSATMEVIESKVTKGETVQDLTVVKETITESIENNKLPQHIGEIDTNTRLTSRDNSDSASFNLTGFDEENVREPFENLMTVKIINKDCINSKRNDFTPNKSNDGVENKPENSPTSVITHSYNKMLSDKNNSVCDVSSDLISTIEDSSSCEVQNSNQPAVDDLRNKIKCGEDNTDNIHVGNDEKITHNENSFESFDSDKTLESEKPLIENKCRDKIEDLPTLMENLREKETEVTTSEYDIKSEKSTIVDGHIRDSNIEEKHIDSIKETEGLIECLDEKGSEINISDNVKSGISTMADVNANDNMIDQKDINSIKETKILVEYSNEKETEVISCKFNNKSENCTGVDTNISENHDITDEKEINSDKGSEILMEYLEEKESNTSECDVKSGNSATEDIIVSSNNILDEKESDILMKYSETILNVCDNNSENYTKVNNDNFLEREDLHSVKDQEILSDISILSPMNNVSDALNQINAYDSDDSDLNTESDIDSTKQPLSSKTIKYKFSKELFSARYQNLFMYESGHCRGHVDNLSSISIFENIEHQTDSTDEGLNLMECNAYGDIEGEVIESPCLKSEDINKIKEESLNQIQSDTHVICNIGIDPEHTRDNDETKNTLDKKTDPTNINIDNNTSDICVNYKDSPSLNDFHKGHYTPDILPRRILKRSFSDSSLLNQNQRSLSLNNNEWSDERFSWCKRKKYNQEECSVQFSRRNSTSIIQKDDVSFCILISDDCIITEPDTEIFVNDICETEDIVVEDVSNVLEVSDNTTGDNTEIVEPTDDFTFHTIEDNVDADVWVDDIGCVETVITDNVVEDSSSSDDTCVFESEDNCILENEDAYATENKDTCVLENLSICTENVIANDVHLNINESNHIYDPLLGSGGDSLYEQSNDLGLNARLYEREKSPLHFVDYGDAPELVLGDDTIKDDLCNLGHHNSIDMAIDLKDSYYNVIDDVDVYTTAYKPTKSLKEIFENDPKDEEFNHEVHTDVLKNYIPHSETQYYTIHSCEPNNEKLPKSKRKTCRTTSSSSPEVTSTTTEEKKSRICLKITNYNGSRVVENSHIKHQNHITETTQYFNSTDRSTQQLITKAAKKYIPPLKEYHDFKVKIRLPGHKLLKLKELKTAKEQPKKTDEVSNMRICRNEYNKITIKKVKPKFEDVLKSLDDIQYNLHKTKTKKTNKTSIPKVVIKKKENGSHYTSSSESEFNPDMSGSKWQPWVFLEKNNFIDGMVINNKRKAVFSSSKNKYVHSGKMRKYSSQSVGTNEKSVQDTLKYTVKA